jgi:hypothetical protein
MEVAMTTSVYIEQTVADALNASAKIAALCNDRVFPLKLPQGAMLPAIVYRRESGRPEYTLQGCSCESVVLALNSYALTYEEAKELALAVRGVMTMPPLRAILQKDTDLYEENVEIPCVRAEYLCHTLLAG